MKTLYNLFAAGALASALFITGCDKQTETVAPLASVGVQDNKNALKLDAPTIAFVSASPVSITLSVCAGATGAPAGFSVQWMLRKEFVENGGWPVSSEVLSGSSFCKASFSGVPGASFYNLSGTGATQCTQEVKIGDAIFDQVGASSPCGNMPLKCGEEYVFRAFAHNDPQGRAKSDWSINAFGTTLVCNGGTSACTYTQGYWGNHGPAARGNNTNVWPVQELRLGLKVYSAIQLKGILDQPGGGNGLVALAHQLIAAELNIANRASDADISGVVADAHTLIGNLDIPRVTSYIQDPTTLLYTRLPQRQTTTTGTGSLSTSGSALTTALDNYNQGITGPGHCE